MALSRIKHIFNQFRHTETYRNHIILTSGHINDTYKIETVSGNDFVLQRINISIFPNTTELLANKIAVINHLKKTSQYKISEYIKVNDQYYQFADKDSSIWTLCNFIKNTQVFMIPENTGTAYQAGKLLGDFHKSMKNYDVESLFEIIPDFHNLTSRKNQFKSALKNANKEVIKECQNEIKQINTFGSDAEYLDTLKTSGKLPLRVTHNDAKLANMLFNKASLEASAIIDLDTIMPGIIHYDIGDAIRSICSTVNEDEPDISKVDFNKDYYKAFMEGFLPILRLELTALEKKTIAISIKYMVYEQSLRFLTDYLNENTYYKVDYPKHNLVRTRNQLRLLEIINQQFVDIKSITERILVNH